MQLEAAAARHGLYRDLAVTPTEFTVALLDATPAPPAATQGLRRLYHRARFSEHPVTPGDVQEAAGYLRAIAEALEVMVG
ncbi:MAG: DUF4129 domain-containing protein [Bifidobacteriaceae bacterium]|nr:DUF4129 domain-containing protein [Bifidobacteriaceae bacterium]